MNSNIFRRNICLILLCLCALAAMPLGKIVGMQVRAVPFYFYMAFVTPKTEESTSLSSNTSQHFGNDIADGDINGYGYVDLGLPSGTKWATCNVGALSPSDYGDYFTWGEISPKSTDKQRNHEVTYFISGSPLLDAARANWGSTWRIPTDEEWEELSRNCAWTWAKLDSHNGYMVTGPNGRSIFLSAAGCLFESSPNYVGEYGSYWSSMSYGSEDASCLAFASTFHRVEHFGRDYGSSIRPVSE